MLVVVVIVLAVVLVIASGVILARQGNPEDASSHADDVRPDTKSERFYRGADRPAGPDADGGPGDGIHR